MYYYGRSSAESFRHATRTGNFTRVRIGHRIDGCCRNYQIRLLFGLREQIRYLVCKIVVRQGLFKGYTGLLFYNNAIFTSDTTNALREMVCALRNGILRTGILRNWVFNDTLQVNTIRNATLRTGILINGDF